MSFATKHSNTDHRPSSPGGRHTRVTLTLRHFVRLPTRWERSSGSIWPTLPDLLLPGCTPRRFRTRLLSPRPCTKPLAVRPRGLLLRATRAWQRSSTPTCSPAHRADHSCTSSPRRPLRSRLRRPPSFGIGRNVPFEGPRLLPSV